jgi:excinuclease UvrABC nuclease subunit
MHEVATLLEQHVLFDPRGDFDAFLREVPAKWVVYLVSDADDRPVQLLCVKNLRASLKRRLGGDEQVGPSRRVNYRDVVRHIRYRRVDSAFEADWLYYEVARQLFPQSYQGMVGFRPAWFVHVNPESPFPRYTKTTDLSKPGLHIGPLEDKHVAGRLVQLVEDLFDLCRYYNLLVEAPNAKACAYKEMGKCPAPCDGSISMEQYRHVIEWSARTLVDPADFIRMHTCRMQQASAELQFEAAGKIKAYVNQLSQLGKGPYRYARWLKDFQFVSFQHGPREGTAKVFLITPGRIEELACMIDEPRWPAELLGVIVASADAHSRSEREGNERMLKLGLASIGRGGDVPLGQVPIQPAEGAPAMPDGGPGVVGAERIGIVSHHLFSGKAGHGVFIRIDELEEKGIIKAFRDLRKRPPDEVGELEGIIKELQSL